MKLITLNIWGGHVAQPLNDFIIAHQEIDIFCFQEVYHNAQSKTSRDDRVVDLNIFAKLQELLPEHVGYFRPVVFGIYGIAMFIKHTINVIDEGEVLIHEVPDYEGLGPEHSRNLQFALCKRGLEEFAVLNVHGLWNGRGKTDSQERLAQASRIKAFCEVLRIPYILCGDFNLRPDTQSLAIISEGLDDLIARYGIKDTRTSYYTKAERFADYIFTSPGITVNDFKVLPDEVSDHAALMLCVEC